MMYGAPAADSALTWARLGNLASACIAPAIFHFAAVVVGRDAAGKISMQFRGPAFPQRGYGLLVVDDTSQRAMGILILDQEDPAGHPAIGTVIGGSNALNLYAVRIDWASVNNPRCPLFGGPATQTS